jgi:hypothetical protein
MKDGTQDVESECYNCGEPDDDCNCGWEEESPEVEGTFRLIIGNIPNTAFDLNDIY